MFAQGSSKVMQDGENVWELDADNGYLSYTKMKYVKNLKNVMKSRPREAADGVGEQGSSSVVYEKFPVCGTSTGWFAEQCGTSRDTELSVLGVGISTYFKQLKTLVVMLLVFTLFSIPAMVLFWSAGKHKVDVSASKDND